LRRDDLTQMMKVITLSKKVLEIIDIAYKLRLGEDVNSQHPFVWLKVFDSDELGEFITEILNAFQDLSSGINDWELLDAVIHEWQESDLALQNQELLSSFLSEDFDEVLLTKPRLKKILYWLINNIFTGQIFAKIISQEEPLTPPQESLSSSEDKIKITIQQTESVTGLVVAKNRRVNRDWESVLLRSPNSEKPGF
jgi:hypothetical protein